MFSATLDGDVDVLISRYQHDPVRCEVADDASAGTRTSHHFLDITREGRVAKTAELIADHGPAVVFCRTKHGADRVAAQLQRAGVAAVAIHGGRSQGQRDRALASFASGRSKALVATDVVARGIHVDDVGCVVHFDIAGDHKDYVHRSGRTGRAGAAGVVISLVTEADLVKVRQLQKALGMPLDPITPKPTRPPQRRPGRRPRRAKTTTPK
jgi:superfamily II DNA/RNA helicase